MTAVLTDAETATVAGLSGIGFWYVPSQSRDEVRWSRGVYDFFGYRPEEFRPHRGTWLNLLHPEDLPAYIQFQSSEGRPPRKACFSCRVRTASGVYRWVRVRMMPVEEADGAIGVVGSIELLDLNEHVSAPTADIRTRVRWTMETTVNPAVALTTAGQILHANATAMQYLSLDAAVVGHCLDEFADHGILGRVREALPTIVERRKVFHSVLALDGVLWDLRIMPVLDAAGTVEFLVASWSTESDPLNGEIVSSEARKLTRAVVREVHHRIKNHLQGVIGLLQADVAGHPGLHAAANRAMDQIMAIATVHGLHAVADSGRVPICEVVRLIARQVQGSFKGEVTVVRQNIGRGHVTLDDSHAVPVALVVNELITNALKHGDAGGAPVPVQVILKWAGEGLVLRVRNPARPGAIGKVVADGEGGEGSGAGLQLIQALLPRGHASFDLVHDAGMVEARLELRMPIVRLVAAPAPGSPGEELIRAVRESLPPAHAAETSLWPESHTGLTGFDSMSQSTDDTADFDTARVDD